jgi:thiosulfate/3-mercaptopyruvate sulfurtransferase
MDVFLEQWVAEGREIFYRPVKPVQTTFPANVNPHIRASLSDVREGRGTKLVDFRSWEEYSGQVGSRGKAGHIPGAVSLAWRSLLGEDHRFFAPRQELQKAIDQVGLTKEDRIVAYCHAGPRAALGYLALKELGLNVVLYDGSYAEWIRCDLPVETPE